MLSCAWFIKKEGRSPIILGHSMNFENWSRQAMKLHSFVHFFVTSTVSVGQHMNVCARNTEEETSLGLDVFLLMCGLLIVFPCYSGVFFSHLHFGSNSHACFMQLGSMKQSR